MKKNIIHKAALMLVLCLLLSAAGCTATSVKAAHDQSTSQLSHIYKSIGDFSNGVAIVESKLYGLIDTKGNLILPCEYRKIARYNFGYSNPQIIRDGLIAIENAKGYHGFADINGNIVIPCEYEDAFSFSEGLAAVKKNGQWGVIDKQGNPVWMLGDGWRACGSFHDGIMVITNGARNAYVNNQGTILKESSKLYPFNSGYALTAYKKPQNSNSYRYGFIDTAMNEIIPTVLLYDDRGGLLFDSGGKEWSDFFHDGLAVCYVEGRYGYINETGEIVISGSDKWTRANPFSEGYAVVCEDYSCYSLIDTQGNVIITGYYEICDVHDGKALASIKKGGNLYNRPEGFIDVKNRKFISLPNDTQSNFSRSFHDDLLLVQSITNNMYGYINGKGEFVIPCEYADATDFNNGIAKVKKFWGWGYIDKTGNPITGFDYDKAEDFVDGLAKVQKGDNIIFIDTTGKEVLSLKKSADIRRSGGYISVIQNNYLNIYDEQGNKTF